MNSPAQIEPATGAVDGAWTRAAVILTLASIAPVFAALTWPPAGWSPVRFFAIPVLVGEAILVGLAIKDGFRLPSALRGVTPATRMAAFCWIACATLSMTAAQSSPALAAILFGCMLLHALVGLAIWDRAVAGWLKWQEAIYAALALGAAAYLLVAAVCVSLAWQAPHSPWGYFGAGVSHVRQIGFYGLVLAGLAAGLLGAGSRVLPRSALVALLLAGWFLVEWSGGRAAFGAAICATGVLVALSVGRRRQVLKLSVACSLIAMPLSYVAAPAPQWGPVSIFTRVALNTGNFSSGRAVVWAETWRRIGDAPVIGHGQGQFRQEVKAVRGRYNHPHNSLLQFLYDWGFLGTILLGAMLLRSGITVLRAPLERLRPGLPAIGAGVGLLAMSSLEGSLYHAFPVMVVAICWALIVANAGRNATTSALPRSSPGTPPAAALARDF
jgi:O-antigen ligase